MASVVYSPSARVDLAEIWDYIAADNVSAADDMASKFDAAFFHLSHNPRFGRLRDEIGEGIRTFPVGKYIIMYRPIHGGIDIVRVIHGARDIGSVKP